MRLACACLWPACVSLGLCARLGSVAAIGMPDRVGLALAVLRHHERLWRLALALCDLLHRAPRGDRAILRENVVVLALLRIFVAVLDQEPVGALAAIAVMAHPHQHPAAMQLVAMQVEFQVALLEAALGIFRIPSAAVPQLHRAAAILVLRDRAFEIAVVERMVLDFDRKPLVMRVKRRSSRDGPGLEHAVEFEPQIVMQARCGMLLDHEAALLRWSDLDVARGLRGLFEIALLAVGGKFSRRHNRSHKLTGQA